MIGRYNFTDVIAMDIHSWVFRFHPRDILALAASNSLLFSLLSPVVSSIFLSFLISDRYHSLRLHYRYPVTLHFGNYTLLILTISQQASVKSRM